MKICMLSTSYPRWKGDPSSPFVEDLCKELVKKGIEVNVVAPHDVNTKNYEIIKGVKIHRFQYWFTKKGQKLAYNGGMPYNISHFFISKIQLFSFMLFFFYKGLKISKKCDIVHAQFLLSGLIGVFIKKISRKKVVMTIHAGGLFSLENIPFNKRIARLIAKKVDKLNFVSNYIKKRFLKLLPNNISKQIKDDIIVMPMGVNLEKFTISPIFKEKTKNESNSNSLLFVGRISDKKGISILIDAADIIRKQKKIFHLDIVGDGPLKNDLIKKITDLKLNDYIKFTGKVTEEQLIIQYLSSDIVIVPSIITNYGDTEGFPVVILEAFASGKPIIASEVSGIPEIVKDGVNGYLVESENPDILAKKIIYLMRNKELMKKMGEHGRKKVEENYTWEIISDKTIKIYEKIINFDNTQENNYKRG